MIEGFEWYVLMAVVGVIAFLIGSAWSPLYRLERKSTKIWQGQAGYWQKMYQTLLEEKENQDPINQILRGIPAPFNQIIKPFIQQIMQNPELLQNILQKLIGKTEEGYRQEWR